MEAGSLASKETAVKKKGHRYTNGNTYAVGVDHRSPRKKFITQRLIGILHETSKRPEGAEMERVAVIVEKLVSLAEEGDVEAIKYIFDRVEGKTPQLVDMFGSVADDEDFEFSVTIGRRGPDGTETATKVHLRKTLAVSKAI